MLKRTAIAALIFFAAAVHAQYGRMDFTLQNAQGQAISGANVTLYTQPACGQAATSTLAALYPAATGGTALGNPLTTDGYGHAFAYATPACYTVVYSSPFLQAPVTYPDQIPNASYAQGPAGPAGPAGPSGPPGGSLSYPGVTTDGANGLTIAGKVSQQEFTNAAVLLTADDTCAAGNYWIAPIAGSLNAWRQCTNGTVSSIGGVLPASFAATRMCGDSLTAGGQNGSLASPASALAPLLNQPVYNTGVFGQTSYQMLNRCYTGTTLAAGVTIPTSGTVNMTFPANHEVAYNTQSVWIDMNGATQTGMPVSGTVCGVTGTLLDNGSHVYAFTPNPYPASPVSCPTNSAWTPTPIPGGWQIFWGGRNNPTDTTQIETAWQQFAAAQGSGQNWLILGVTNGEGEPSGSGNYNAIVAANTFGASTYGSHFLDIRSILVANYNSGNGVDVYDHTNDIPPYTLRAKSTSATLYITAALTDTVTCPTLSTGNGAVAGSVLQIDNEYILQLASGCTRGFGGSTATTHVINSLYNPTDWEHWGAAGDTVIGKAISQAILAVTGTTQSSLQQAFATIPPFKVPSTFTVAGPVTVGGSTFAQIGAPGWITSSATGNAIVASAGNIVGNCLGAGGTGSGATICVVSSQFSLNKPIVFSPDLTQDIGNGSNSDPRIIHAGTSFQVRGDTAWSAGPRAFITGRTGALTSVTAGQLFNVYKIVKSGTIENVENVAIAVSCTGSVNWSLVDCGTTAGICSSPTQLAGINIATSTTAGTWADGTILSATLTAGHYVGWQTVGGTCTSLDLSGTVEYRLN